MTISKYIIGRYKVCLDRYRPKSSLLVGLNTLSLSKPYNKSFCGGGLRV
jgi:hypothetical protein